MHTRIIRSYALVVVLLMAIGPLPHVGWAQSAADSDEAAIESAEEEMRQAIIDGDLQTLERLWQPDFMVNAPRHVVVPNRAAVLEVFRAGIAAYDRYEQTRDTIRVADDQAVVMGSETVQPVGDDAPHAGQTVHRRYTHVWQATDEGWRLALRHAHIEAVE